MNKKQLSGPKQRVIEQCQDIAFGRITFHVAGGEPDLGRPWRTRRTVKLNGGENGPRPETASNDFELRKEHLALLDQMARLSDGACVTIEVKHGLPFIIEIDQEHRVA